VIVLILLCILKYDEEGEEDEGRQRPKKGSKKKSLKKTIYEVRLMHTIYKVK
jgi:hypothetical protein